MNMAHFSSRQIILTAVLIFGTMFGASRSDAACSSIRNVVALSTLGAQMMGDPTKTYSTRSARQIEVLRGQLERRALRKMLDARYMSIHFPEVMSYFAKLKELSNIIRLYGTKEMRRYVQREKLDKEAAVIDQLIGQLCTPVGEKPAGADSSAAWISLSGLITSSYQRTAKARTAGKQAFDWKVIALALIAIGSLASVAWLVLAQRRPDPAPRRNACWITASLRLKETLIFGHMRRLDEASGQFVCNPMQRQVAETALADATTPVLELGADKFDMHIAPPQSPRDTSRTELRFDTPLEPQALAALLAQSAQDASRKRKWRGLIWPRHSLQN